MKLWWIISIAFGLLPFQSFSQDISESLFDSFDRQMIRFWEIEKSKNFEDILSAYKELDISLEFVLDKLIVTPVDENNLSESVSFLRTWKNILLSSIATKNSKKIQYAAESLRQEMDNIKMCFYISDPEFLLWQSFDTYIQVHEVLNDPMQGLLEWNEQQELAEDFFSSWISFKLKSLEIDWGSEEEKINTLIAVTDSCVEDLKLAFDRAQQGEMALECNEILPNLKRLISFLGA